MLHPQQGWKGSFCPLAWFPTSSPTIVTNNPWLRLVLTMTTTALILVMAVLNMVRRTSKMKLSPGAVKTCFLFASFSWRIPKDLRPRSWQRSHLRCWYLLPLRIKQTPACWTTRRKTQQKSSFTCPWVQKWILLCQINTRKPTKLG